MLRMGGVHVTYIKGLRNKLYNQKVLIKLLSEYCNNTLVVFLTTCLSLCQIERLKVTVFDFLTMCYVHNRDTHNGVPVMNRTQLTKLHVSSWYFLLISTRMLV